MRRNLGRVGLQKVVSGARDLCVVRRGERLRQVPHGAEGHDGIVGAPDRQDGNVEGRDMPQIGQDGL